MRSTSGYALIWCIFFHQLQPEIRWLPSPEVCRMCLYCDKTLMHCACARCRSWCFFMIESSLVGNRGPHITNLLTLKLQIGTRAPFSNSVD